MPSSRAVRPLLAVASALVLVACGGQQFVAGVGDGGSGGSSSGSEAGACVTAPGDAGAESDFCALETRLFTTCGDCTACYQTDLNECAALGESLSTAFKSALASCESQLVGNHVCNNYSTYGTNPCVAAALTNSTKSSAQIAAATTYCSKCAATSGLSACVTDYFQPPQPDGGSAGVGYVVLLGNDTTAAAVQASCTPSPVTPLSCLTGTVDAYELCALNQFCKDEPTEACSTGICK
jgi:hypothetical protein